MNGNANGAKMLAYMRGERDLSVERQRLIELRRQMNKSGLGYWLSNPEKPQVKRFWQMVTLLEENSRMTLTEMSKRLSIPISTVFDMMKKVEKYFRFTIVLRENQRSILAGNISASLEFCHQYTPDIDEGKEIPLHTFI